MAATHALLVMVIGPSPARRKPMTKRGARLWKGAVRRSYAGLLIGIGLGIALLAVLLAE